MLHELHKTSMSCLHNDGRNREKKNFICVSTHYFVKLWENLKKTVDCIQVPTVFLVSQTSPHVSIS